MWADERVIPPYQVHANRELGLMLRGSKPLAFFSDIEGHVPEVVTRYLRMFDRHVAVGTFIKGEHRRTIEVRNQPMILHTVLYALPQEAWRIDAMIGLRSEQGSSLEQ
jgi:hypothetical protein